MNAERLFYEMELRWVNLLQKTQKPELRACAGVAAQRERELRATLEKMSGSKTQTALLAQTFPGGARTGGTLP